MGDRYQRLVDQMAELQRVKSMIDEACPVIDYANETYKKKLDELVDHSTPLNDLIHLLLGEFGALPSDDEDGKARVQMIIDGQHVVDPFDINSLRHWEDFEVSIGVFRYILAHMKYPVTHRDKMPVIEDFALRYHHLFPK